MFKAIANWVTGRRNISDTVAGLPCGVPWDIHITNCTNGYILQVSADSYDKRNALYVSQDVDDLIETLKLALVNQKLDQVR